MRNMTVYGKVIIITGGARGLAKLLAERNGEEDAPAEDEGIPGHHPGSANVEKNAPTVLSKLSLGPLHMESDLMEDVKAELQDLDSSNPPATGQNSYSDEFEQRLRSVALVAKSGGASGDWTRG